MEYLIKFFKMFFPAVWEFFKLPFPFLDMTIAEFAIGCSLIVFSFYVLSMILSVRFGSIRGDRSIKSNRYEKMIAERSNRWKDYRE